MFSQRVVSICLLIAYGVPASVGSSWHAHDLSSVSSCCRTCIQANNGPSTVSTNSAAFRSRACCSGQHHGGNVTGNSSTSLVDSGSGRLHSQARHDGQSAGPCAICSFYAQATCLQAVLVPCRTAAALQIVLQSQSSSRSANLYAFDVRGPPVILLD